MNQLQVTPPEPLLSIKDLHVWYELRRFGFGHAGFVKAVDGVSFDLAEGETVAVVGESGCGKSSLMKTILGLNIPTSGNVVFDGESLSGIKGNDLRHYRFKIGYVQQDPYGALPPKTIAVHFLYHQLRRKTLIERRLAQERAGKLFSERRPVGRHALTSEEIQSRLAQIRESSRGDETKRL